jgi:uncharacterized membrane protein YiaA
MQSTQSPPSPKNTGIVLLIVGLANLAIAIVAHKPVFYGVAPGLIAMGVIFLAKSRATP